MKILVVASYDSFLRAGDRFARRLEKERDADVSHAIVHLRDGQLSPEQFRAIGVPMVTPEPLDQIVSKRRLADFDIVVLALNGLRTRRFANRFRTLFDANDTRRPVTVSLYPGLIFRFHLEGFMSRMSSDLVLLNSIADKELYDQMVAGMGLNETNSVVGGLSFLPARRPPQADGSTVVFVGQPTVPAGRTERLFVLEELVRFARRHPSTPVCLKPRHRPNEQTLHRMRYHYRTLADEAGLRLPSNLTFSYASMESVLDETGLLLTFSSTAALEAMARGIPTRILTDIGINENVGNFWFMGSGALIELGHVEPGMPFVLDDAWYARNAAAAELCLPRVLERIDHLIDEQRSRGHALPPPHDHLFGRTADFTRYVTNRGSSSDLEHFGDVKRKSRVQRLGGALRKAWKRARR